MIKGIFVSFIPYFSNSFAAFYKRKKANELDGVRRKQMKSDRLNPNSHNLRN